MKNSAEERENLLQKFMDYDLRIESLELEKRSLNQNLEKTQSVSQATQGEVDRLASNLRLVLGSVSVVLLLWKMFVLYCKLSSPSFFFLDNKFFFILVVLCIQ